MKRRKKTPFLQIVQKTFGSRCVSLAENITANNALLAIIPYLTVLIALSCQGVSAHETPNLFSTGGRPIEVRERYAPRLASMLPPEVRDRGNGHTGQGLTLWSTRSMGLVTNGLVRDDGGNRIPIGVGVPPNTPPKDSRAAWRRDEEGGRFIVIVICGWVLALVLLAISKIGRRRRSINGREYQ